jgi:hypothetical protein
MKNQNRRDFLMAAGASAVIGAVSEGAGSRQVYAQRSVSKKGSEWDYRTTKDLVEALESRRISAIELTEHVIARIEALDPSLNAVVVRDFDRARRMAEMADVALSRGERRPLLGVPMVVKESFNVAGLPTTWGIPTFKDWTPKDDAITVLRLKAAGAIILGKSNVPINLLDWQSYNELYAPYHSRTKPHRCRRVRQADLDFECPRHGVGLRRNLPDSPGRSHARIIRQAYRDRRVGWCRSEQLSRHVEHGIPPVLARHPNYQLPGLHHLAAFGSRRRYNSRRIDLQFGIAHPVPGDFQLRLGDVVLRTSGRQGLFCTLELSARGDIAGEKRLLPLKIALGLGELCPRRSEGCLGRTQRVQFIVRLKLRDHLARRDPIADVDRSFDHASGDTKRQTGFILRFDASRIAHGFADRVLGDRDGPNRANLCRGRFGFALASAEQNRRRQRRERQERQ